MKNLLVFVVAYALLTVFSFAGFKYFNITEVGWIFTSGALSAILADMVVDYMKQD